MNEAVQRREAPAAPAVASPFRRAPQGTGSDAPPAGVPAAPWRAGSHLSRLYLQAEGQVFALAQATGALLLIIELLKRRGFASPLVYVPAYFCENGLGPVRQGARLALYPVTEAMAPDWPAVEVLAEREPPALFILPHFFGVVGESAEARRFCDRVGALLHEDAAHVLLPVGGIGSHGDFATYSPRKFFTVPDGGVLVVRGAALAVEMEAVASGMSQHRPAIAPFLFKRMVRSLGPHRTSPLKAHPFDAEPDDIELLPGVLMSGFSHSRLEAAASRDFSAVSRHERDIARVLEAELPRRLPLVPLPRAVGSVPYLLAFRGQDEAQTEDAYRRLRAAGAAVATWPGLPPEVWAMPADYGAALRIRRTLLRFMPRISGRRHPLDFLKRL